ncbi:GHKL domain-containing protein [Ligilactobacillus murinus]|uniref:GHKL domain-containing protein n=1 Tax=Ligilactobacillus murinus TaxID=1622 RepID=UPI002DD65ED8|nr:GHKL domain-containing protein [Ligilactobacillus murinus]WRY37673.1 GHKL domain-containing protein [Ligilactobacillus murinus]
MIVILYVVKTTTKIFENYERYVVTQTPILAWSFNIIIIASLYLLYAINYKMLVTSLLIFYLIGIGLLLCGIWFMKHTADYYKFKTLSYSTMFELTELQQYTSQIEVMYDDMRRFRHDYKNILYSLSSAIDTNDITLVKKAFDSVVIPTQKDVTTSTSVLADLKNLQNIEIKSLIYNKIMYALDKGLKFEVEVEHKIKLTDNFELLDAVRCISILLDNAINAALNSKEKKINFSFFNSDGIQYLIVGNSTKEEMIDLGALVQQDSKLGSSHGIGLKNLQMILARYPNIQNNGSSNSYWFEQVLMIPLKS